MSTESRRIKLVVSYDGTDFSGWAAQAGRRTVQGTLTEAVRRISGEDTELFGASRTDSGAHAEGQVAHFDAPAAIPPDRWRIALGPLLPLDLRVVASLGVRGTFSARFDAERRRYRYRLLRRDDDPFQGRFAHVAYGRLDLDAMRRAGAALAGEHDFRAFTEELDPVVNNTVRNLFAVDVRSEGDVVAIEVEGTAFLRGMMRRIAGFLLEVGRGRRSPDDATRLLGPRREELTWPVVLPARGLCLVEVRYKPGSE